MPRRADPRLEARILGAAQRLWIRGGEESLTLRAVAKSAGTNTPAVYRRYKNRREILLALAAKVQDDLGQVVRRGGSLQEIAEAVLEYAMEHPREYELLLSKVVTKSKRPRPNLDYVLDRAAAWLGGTAEQHVHLVIAIWALVYGTATLLNTEAIPQYTGQTRRAFEVAVDELIRNHQRFAAE